MNELKQIRSMAEMILEKVSTLECAQPFTKDIGFDHVARDYESKPKFSVGDSVCTTNGDEGKVTGIHKLDGHYRYRYLVLFANGDHHHVVEPLLRLIKSEPKFQVGDWVRIEQLVAEGDVAPVGTVVNVYMGSNNIYDIAIIDDPRFGSGNRRKMVWEKYLTKVEVESEWHSGPPPHVGWWLASYSKRTDTWRWWNGKNWSAPAIDDHSAKQAGTAANTEHNLGLGKIIQWTDYWPENARVPRINPGV